MALPESVFHHLGFRCWRHLGKSAENIILPTRRREGSIVGELPCQRKMRRTRLSHTILPRELEALDLT